VVDPECIGQAGKSLAYFTESGLLRARTSLICTDMTADIHAEVADP
jgi:hypothetical protein